MTTAELRFFELVPAKLRDAATSSADIASELHTLNANMERLIALAEAIMEGK